MLSYYSCYQNLSIRLLEIGKLRDISQRLWIVSRQSGLLGWYLFRVCLLDSTPQYTNNIKDYQNCKKHKNSAISQHSILQQKWMKITNVINMSSYNVGECFWWLTYGHFGIYGQGYFAADMNCCSTHHGFWKKNQLQKIFLSVLFKKCTV